MTDLDEYNLNVDSVKSVSLRVDQGEATALELVEYMEQYQYMPSMQSKILKSLANLVYGSKRLQNEVIRLKVGDKIVRAMENYPKFEKLQDLALIAIISVIAHNRKGQDALMEAGIDHALLNTMQNYTESSSCSSACMQGHFLARLQFTQSFTVAKGSFW